MQIIISLSLSFDNGYAECRYANYRSSWELLHRVLMPIVIMLVTNSLECRYSYFYYVECHYAESCDANCHYVVNNYAMS